MRRIAIYCRVSTLEQRPEIQLDVLRAYAQNRGLEIAGEYIDHGVSGAKDRRPALDAKIPRLDSQLDRWNHRVAPGRQEEARGVAKAERRKDRHRQARTLPCLRFRLRPATPLRDHHP